MSHACRFQNGYLLKHTAGTINYKLKPFSIDASFTDTRLVFSSVYMHTLITHIIQKALRSQARPWLLVWTVLLDIKWKSTLPTIWLQTIVANDLDSGNTDNPDCKTTPVRGQAACPRWQQGWSLPVGQSRGRQGRSGEQKWRGKGQAAAAASAQLKVRPEPQQLPGPLPPCTQF